MSKLDEIGERMDQVNRSFWNALGLVIVRPLNELLSLGMTLYVIVTGLVTGIVSYICGGALGQRIRDAAKWKVVYLKESDKRADKINEYTAIVGKVEEKSSFMAWIMLFPVTLIAELRYLSYVKQNKGNI